MQGWGRVTDEVIETDKKYTPEHRLWFAVLGTYANQMRETWSSMILKHLPIQADNVWTREICEWLDLDFKAFIDGLRRIADGRRRSVLYIENLNERISSVCSRGYMSSERDKKEYDRLCELELRLRRRALKFKRNHREVNPRMKRRNTARRLGLPE